MNITTKLHLQKSNLLNEEDKAAGIIKKKRTIHIFYIPLKYDQDLEPHTSRSRPSLHTIITNYCVYSYSEEFFCVKKSTYIGELRFNSSTPIEEMNEGELINEFTLSSFLASDSRSAVHLIRKTIPFEYVDLGITVTDLEASSSRCHVSVNLSEVPDVTGRYPEFFTLNNWNPVYYNHAHGEIRGGGPYSKVYKGEDLLDEVTEIKFVPGIKKESFVKSNGQTVSLSRRSLSGVELLNKLFLKTVINTIESVEIEYNSQMGMMINELTYFDKSFSKNKISYDSPAFVESVANIFKGFEIEHSCKIKAIFYSNDVMDKLYIRFDNGDVLNLQLPKYKSMAFYISSLNLMDGIINDPVLKDSVKVCYITHGSDHIFDPFDLVEEQAMLSDAVDGRIDIKLLS